MVSPQEQIQVEIPVEAPPLGGNVQEQDNNLDVAVGEGVEVREGVNVKVGLGVGVIVRVRVDVKVTVGVLVALAVTNGVRLVVAVVVSAIAAGLKA